MTDMTAFERRVADAMVLRAGPVRPVDDLAVYESVIAAKRQNRWGFTMFSALKFIAASVIVALFGGFLMMGVFTMQQGDEMVPAAVTATPEPETTSEPTESPDPSVRTDILPGVELTVEEVEPGVYRVIDDGVREIALDISTRDVGYTIIEAIAGHDGSVWLAGESTAFRLGAEPTYGRREDYGLSSVPEADLWPGWLNPVDMVVAPDGIVWNHGFAAAETHGLYAFDGETWTVERPRNRFDAVTVGSDGDVWAVWNGNRVGRVDPEWEVVTSTPDEYQRDDAGGLTVGDDGDIWLWPQNTWFWDPTQATHVYHHDGGMWRSIDLPGGDFGSVAVGQDGTVWWTLYDDQGRLGDKVVAVYRFDGEGWERWDAVDDWPPLMHRPYLRRYEVAPDGRLWVLPSAIGAPLDGCGDGPVLFGGDRWTQYLSDLCVVTADMAADGSVWVLAAEPSTDEPLTSRADAPAGLYVITPEAVAASD